MKLLFYSPQFHPSVGGLQYVVQMWARELTLMGQEIVVVCKESFTHLEPFGFNVIRNPSFWQEIKLMRSADKVVMFNVSLKAILQWAVSGKQLVLSHHSALYHMPDHKPFRQRVKKWVASNLASANICCSRFIAGSYFHSQVVYSPFEAAVFKNRNQQRNNNFLFVGRLVSDKGVDILIKAFIQLTKILSGSYQLNIYGDGSEKNALQKLINDAGLSSQIVIHGFANIEEIVIQMNNHKTLIIPSRMEPFGIVALEGLACGCQLIVSHTGGLPEATGNFANFFEPENIESLALAMQKCYTTKEPPFNNRAVQLHLANCTPAASAALFLKNIAGV